MNWGPESGTRSFEDGLGRRTIELDATDGSTVDVLELSASLAANEAFEQAVRARAAALAQHRVHGVARVRRVERDGETLRIVEDHCEGLRLPDFLHEAVKANAPLPQAAALHLANRIIGVVSALHDAGLSHGAITPSHVVITREGEVALTDAAIGGAIEGLQRNREQLWREFRLALPASASLPRFDQRADVAGLGATVLAIVLGRALRASEYPRPVNDVVVAATLAARPGEPGTCASALRMWLQQALHLHPRAVFSSAVDAKHAFEEVLGASAARRGGAAMFEKSVRRIFGDTPASAAAVDIAAAWSEPAIVHPISEPVGPVDSFTQPLPARQPDNPLRAMFRSVFPLFRAS